jgi:hypothetical protein
MACRLAHLESSGAAEVLSSRSRKLAFTWLNQGDISCFCKILLIGRGNKIAMTMSITPYMDRPCYPSRHGGGAKLAWAILAVIPLVPFIYVVTGGDLW